MIDWASRRHLLIEQSQHIFAQMAINFPSDDVAVVETYKICTQIYSNEAQETIRLWLGKNQAVPETSGWRSPQRPHDRSRRATQRRLEDAVICDSRED